MKELAVTKKTVQAAYERVKEVQNIRSRSMP